MAEFLEHVSLVMDNDSTLDTNKVMLITLHSAKGLEFDTVFLPAWEDGIFPNDKSIKEGGMEEERRLAYVALTRARRLAIITNTMSRVIFGARQYYSPARFITEMDNRYLDFGGRTPRYETPTRPTQPKTHTVKSIVGKLVEHGELGRGVVIESNGGILTVAFNRTGIKKVAESFVKIID
jgi:DNA helicase-2/ATP-dependent DNA helicase PcrA